MNKIDRAAHELREMDELAARQSPVHALHPLTKLLITIAYILFTVSFNKYALSALLVMGLYPVLMFELSGISLRKCLYKLRFALPLVLAVGLFNPFFDRAARLTLGTLAVSGGVISMLTLMLKGLFCLTASFIFAASTQMDAVCAALRRLHIPPLLVTLLLLTYRYVAVMVEEVAIMSEAYRLRAPGQRGIHISAWGAFLGQLLLRSADRAQELYSGMQLRGFNGEFHYAEPPKMRAVDFAVLVAALAAFAVCRRVNIAQALGSLVV